MYDYCVIGAGIVGLATALEISRLKPDAKIVVLDKEVGPATHQTGHNSGVIHSGLYYKRGSLKARLCREGAMAMKAFCIENAVPYREIGKLIVATNPVEVERMQALRRNAAENGIAAQEIGAGELRELEPNIDGLAALRIGESAIVSYRRICEVMVGKLATAGVRIEFGSAVRAIVESGRDVAIETGKGRVTCRWLIACAGLQADRIAAIAGVALEHRIVPFRGEYFDVVRPDTATLVSHMIYPVPDPALPFLGIHLTPMIDGRLTVGPNAVLSLARESYAGNWPSLHDMAAYASFPGFWKMLRANLSSGIREARSSLFRGHYLQECRKYCPSLQLGDLKPYPPGIRAQAVSRDGALVHDFLFKRTSRSLHVLNAPSPAATSSIPIGRMIAETLGIAVSNRHGEPA